MDYERKSNGLQTFLEHWWFLGIVLAALVIAFFQRLSGTPWIWCYAIALIVAAGGVALIFYAKLPLYWQRRFLTFGTRALPEDRKPFYRWGYRCVAFAVVLLLCLLLSSHGRWSIT